MPDIPVTTQAKTIAVIDIGTNSIRMMIAQVSPDGTLDVLDHMQRPVRLGHSTFVTGRLSQQTMNAAIAILRDYRHIIDTYHATRVRAVATSAVSEATNNDAFLDRARIATDLDIEIIDTAEESRLTVSAVRQSLTGVVDVSKGPALIVEIGGGHGLLTILDRGEIAASESYNLGSIRLQEVLGTSGEPPERAADMLRQHIANVVAAIERTVPIWGVDHFIAIGGDARLAAQLAGESLSSDISAVSGSKLDALVADCTRRTAEDLARRHGLPFANAETLTPALLAYQALLKASRSVRMIVSRVSMRDGLLMDLARIMIGKEDPELAAGLLQSARSVCEKYHCDEKHAEHVADLSVKLFDSLRTAHRLPPRYRLLLQVAALMHEVGGYVSSRAHHKHSYYLIVNSVIYGLRRDELEIVAQVARYHRRSSPRSSHREYMAMPREHRMIVNKLAAILRVADGLDRVHAQRISDFAAECQNEEFILRVTGVPDLVAEQRAVTRKADLFEDTYGMKVRLLEGTTVQPVEPSESEVK